MARLNVCFCDKGILSFHSLSLRDVWIKVNAILVTNISFNWSEKWYVISSRFYVRWAL